MYVLRTELGGSSPSQTLPTWDQSCWGKSGSKSPTYGWAWALRKEVVLSVPVPKCTLLSVLPFSGNFLDSLEPHTFPTTIAFSVLFVLGKSRASWPSIRSGVQSLRVVCVNAMPAYGHSSLVQMSISNDEIIWHVPHTKSSRQLKNQQRTTAKMEVKQNPSTLYTSFQQPGPGFSGFSVMCKSV